MNTPIGMLLSRKGSHIYSVDAAVSVADAVRTMNQHRVGSILILDRDHLVGIFTERDVLTRVVAAGRNPYATPVTEVMTRNLVTIPPTATVEEVMDLFTTRRCRHIPVVASNQLQGLISIGDISRWLVDTHRAEAEQLRQYIAGVPA